MSLSRLWPNQTNMSFFSSSCDTWEVNKHEKTAVFSQNFFYLTKLSVFCKNNGDFICFPKNFPVFCVIIHTPGGNIKTQKTGNFLGKRVKSLFFGLFFLEKRTILSDRKIFVLRFCILIYPPGELEKLVVQ